jgi:hypothetical protein
MRNKIKMIYQRNTPMFNFFFKPHFYFVNEYILSVFLHDFFTLHYQPSTFFSDDPAYRRISPALFYDFSFYTYIHQLITSSRSFLGLKPNTFLYFAAVGLFLRLIWTFGAGRRFFPGSGKNDPVKFFGFYDLWFTPFGSLFRCFFFAKLFFTGFNATHYKFNPSFYLYRHPRLIRPLQNSDHYFVNYALHYPARSARIATLLLFEILVFIFSFFFHFFRPLIWGFMRQIGATWPSIRNSFQFVRERKELRHSIGSLPYFFRISFARASRVVIKDKKPLVVPYRLWTFPRRITLFFNFSRQAYRNYLLLSIRHVWGIVRPYFVFPVSSYHYKYTQLRAANETFSAYKLKFIEAQSKFFSQNGSSSDAQLGEVPLNLQRVPRLHKIFETYFWPLSRERKNPVIVGDVPIRTSGERYNRWRLRIRSYLLRQWVTTKSLKRYEKRDRAFAVLNFLTRRADFFVYKGYSIFSILFQFFLQALNYVGAFFYFFLTFLITLIFGPGWQLPTLPRVPPHYFTNLFVIVRSYLIDRPLTFFRVVFGSFFFLGFFQPLLTSVFSPVIVRFREYSALAIYREHFFMLKRLFFKRHHYGIYTNWALDADEETVPTEYDRFFYDYQDPEDAYDTDWASGDTYDVAFQDADLYGSSNLFQSMEALVDSTPYFEPEFSSPYFEFGGSDLLSDRAVSQNFFELNEYNKETNIAQIWFVTALIPGLYDFFCRKQYQHIARELKLHNLEQREDPRYHAEERTIDYDTHAPNVKLAEKIVGWGNRYAGQLDNWKNGAVKRSPFLTASELLRGSGNSLLTQNVFNKLTKSDWVDLTFFVDSLTRGSSYAAPEARAVLDAKQFRVIWAQFAEKAKTSPEVLVTRVIKLKSMPFAFEKHFLYPYGAADSVANTFFINVFKFLFGEVGFAESRWFQVFSKTVRVLPLKYLIRGPRLSTLKSSGETINLINLFLHGYMQPAEFEKKLTLVDRNPYTILSVTSYLRSLAVTDFNKFKKSSELLGSSWIFSIIKFHEKYGEIPFVRNPYARRKRGTFSSRQYENVPFAFFNFFYLIKHFFFRSSVKNFSGAVFDYIKRRPQESSFHFFFGTDADNEDRFKIPRGHTRTIAVLFSFLPTYFSELFSKKLVEPTTESELSLFKFLRLKKKRNRRQKKNSLFFNDQVLNLEELSSELRIFNPLRPYTVNPFPNEHAGWGLLSPFLTNIQSTFYDPHFIDLCLPPQFDWLALEQNYVNDQENDLDHLDLHDEYLESNLEFADEDTEELAPGGPYESYTGEEDMSSFSSDPEFYDDMLSSYQDSGEQLEAERNDEEFFDIDYGELTHYTAYALDSDEFAYQNFEEEEWFSDDFNLFSDSSIPLSRLFIGGLKTPGSFPATDPRLFIGAFDQFPRDINLHFSRNFNLAKKNVEERSLVPLYGDYTPETSKKKVNFFFRNPIVSVFVRIFIYAYVLATDTIYTYIFFDFQSRPDVKLTRMHLASFNHYFRWSSFYGNKYYFQKFSTALTSWLHDFQDYAAEPARFVSASSDAQKFFAYFPHKAPMLARLKGFQRFISSVPLFSFMHLTDRTSSPYYQRELDFMKRYEGDFYTALFKYRRWSNMNKSFFNFEISPDFFNYVAEQSKLERDRVKFEGRYGWGHAEKQRNATVGYNYNHPEKWTLFERLRFSVIYDLPGHTYIPNPALMRSFEEYNLWDRSTYFEFPDEHEFSEYDDALMMSYSTEADFTSHVDELESRTAILHTALLDLFDLARDYTVYAVRLFINTYIISPFTIWTTYSDTFWLKLSIRLGFWVNFVRYLFVFSIYLVILSYLSFVFPRITYDLLGDAFSFLILFALNSLLLAFLAIFFAFVSFSPVYHYVASLKSVERAAYVFLFIFIYFQHIFYGYHRAGISIPLSLDGLDDHAEISRLPGELNYDVPHERNQRFDRYGPAHYNIEVDGTYTPVEFETILNERRQKLFWRGEEAFQEPYKRSFHIDFVYSQGPFNLSSFFYTLKTQLFKLRNRAVVGSRYYTAPSALRTTQQFSDEVFELIHRPETVNLGYPTNMQRYREWQHGQIMIGVMGNIFGSRIFEIDTETRTTNVTDALRTNRASYFSDRYHGFEGLPSWTAFPYDFRVKSLDHNHSVYTNDLGISKKIDIGFNAHGQSPRDRNYVVRMPVFKEFFGDNIASAADAKKTQPQSADSQTDPEDVDDLFFEWPYPQRREGIQQGLFTENSTPEDIFGTDNIDESVFISRGKQPRSHYFKQFKLYGQGDWLYRRQLLNDAYRLKNKKVENVWQSANYYYFLRKRASDGHFTDFYSKNLRDFLLYNKPEGAYAFQDIYGMSDELRHLSKVYPKLLSYTTSPYGPYSFSRREPYYDKIGAKSAKSFNSDYLANTISHEFDDAYQAHRAIPTEWWAKLPFLGAKLYDVIRPGKNYTESYDAISPGKRAEFLALAKAIRGERYRNKTTRIANNFSDFYFYKNLIPSESYPTDALSFYLDFENFNLFKYPGFALPTGHKVVDPYYQALLKKYPTQVAKRHLPSAYSAAPSVPALQAGLGHNFINRTRANKRTYDPIRLYDLPANYQFYTFPRGSHGDSARFSYIFDNSDVYAPNSQEARAFNRSTKINKDFLNSVAEYEDFLDAFLERTKSEDEDYLFSPGSVEERIFAQFPLYEDFFIGMGLYEKYPISYEFINDRDFTEVRKLLRLAYQDETFFNGENRLNWPGIRPHSGKLESFHSFVDYLAAVDDNNRVSVLKKVYFSDFLDILQTDDFEFDEYLEIWAPEEAEGEERLDIASELVTTPYYYGNRWLLPNLSYHKQLDSYYDKPATAANKIYSHSRAVSINKHQQHTVSSERFRASQRASTTNTAKDGYMLDSLSVEYQRLAKGDRQSQPQSQSQALLQDPGQDMDFDKAEDSMNVVRELNRAKIRASREQKN